MGEDLFAHKIKEDLRNEAPLADRMRPRDFSEFVGQDEVAGEGRMLRKLIEQDETPSLIFWGPPGVGKTTLARLIAEKTSSAFVSCSAVDSGLADLRGILKEAEERRKFHNQRTILFIDEIHRWNKAQQDALLPYVERGAVTLIGATTENPSFEVIGALLSRCRVFVLKPLPKKEIVKLLAKAIKDKERGFGKLNVEIEDGVLDFLGEAAGGDARVALNALEMAMKAKPAIEKEAGFQLTLTEIKEALQRTHLVFDKRGEEFYNLISALHKSMRGSDADAALYWLARMLEGGADPLYVARRILRFAAEDIGLADSRALLVASAAYDACHKIGMPECAVHLAEAAVYCALAKKSNALYRAYEAAAEDARKTSHLGAPLHLRNAPTRLMKDLGYGRGYKYSPDFNYEEKQEYMPEDLKGRKYLTPDKKEK
ncbi:MAG: replication-associated recombination protein A [Candidatus Magasanikbacteria bacterium]|nr:replication-associated recombination protein A [Candidatus Magasanikbacteria bacterium]